MQTKKQCVILGGGGHARVIIDTLQTSMEISIHAILDPDASRWEKELYGIPIRGGDDLIPLLIEEGVSHFVIGVGSVGDAQVRINLFEMARSFGLQPLTIRHPSMICSQYAAIGLGAQLLPSAVINAGAQVGQNVIVNSGAIIEHDCRIDDHVHVATGAKIASTVHVGRGAHIGAGATIRESITIGNNALVGAGAVVVKDVPAGTTVVGNPARII